jgi:hypothetical protein
MVSAIFIFLQKKVLETDGEMNGTICEAIKMSAIVGSLPLHFQLAEKSRMGLSS